MTSRCDRCRGVHVYQRGLVDHARHSEVVYQI